ncbi:tetratricopeptide repeat protein [Winogradskyella sp.]|uniref:tetratricopeptide repeat protein n=1 Tax=Winogradskyella sp. TaxID=1883156 RepID=UPI003BAADAA2
MSPEVKKKWINTLKFFAAYLVAAWTFLQFVDWVLNRYNISPHWVDILLWFFIGISPSLLIYLYHQERLSKRIVKLREKILIPLNFIILFIGLYFGFGNTDLGATTKEVKYTDEQGLAQSEIITKEEFRIGVPIFGFKNLTKDESLNWMRYGIGRLLEEDLYQNKSLSPYFSFITNTRTKIEEASLFNDFYIDGDYKKEGDNYVINVFKKKATNGKILAQDTFSGAEFLPLIDEITVFIIENSGFVETRQLRYLDYPINEFMSDSMTAIKEYINGNYTKAVAIDKKFALAYLAYAKQSLRVSRGKLEVQDLTDKAFENRNRLPLQKQLEVHIQRNLAYENFEDAAEQVKLQLEVDPHNEFYNQVLFSIYGETQETDKYLEASYKLFDIDQDAETGMNLAIAALVNGDDDLLIQEIKKYEIISPNLKIFRLQPLLFKGDLKKAEDLLEDIGTLYPGYRYRASVYDSAVVYLKKNGYNINRFKNFEGTYRAGFNEQVHTFWIEHNRVIQYVKNQIMYALLPGGDHILVTGFINNETYKYELILDDNGKPIGYLFHELYNKNKNLYWYWKEDEVIKKAHEAFDSGNHEEATSLYEIALRENPKHTYLKNTLDHLNYIVAKGKDSIQSQNISFAGDYGPRKFWVEDGKFYYKRKDANTELPKVELLPISENRYMDLTRLGTIMAFEEDPSGKMASKSYSFIVGEDLEFVWRHSSGDDNATNYFVKDD